MGKYNSNQTNTDYYEDYLKKELWLKDKENYVPYINTRSLSSKGKVYRIKGWKTGRIHHLLSTLELGMFYYLEWADYVIDIKEQYPLLSVEETQIIAEKAGIKHSYINNEATVMTTDFLFTVKETNNYKTYVRTVKPVSELSDERVLEKFEIERRYFMNKDIDWAIITEKELSNTFIANMNILHGDLLNDKIFDLENIYQNQIYEKIATELDKSNSKEYPIAYILTQVALNLNTDITFVNKMFYKGITQKLFKVDIFNNLLDLSKLPTSYIEIDKKLIKKAI